MTEGRNKTITRDAITDKNLITKKIFFLEAEKQIFPVVSLVGERGGGHGNGSSTRNK